MFKSISNKGFQITFENGWTISVMYGSMTYTENYHMKYGSELKQSHVNSKDAEIAIWDKDGNWYDFGKDKVKGYCTPEEVADWIFQASKW